MSDFASALVAALPCSSIPSDQRIFEPLIGSWDLVVESLDESGDIARTSAGEWHFSWVLEGRAIQDVWIVPPRGDRTSEIDNYEYGTSLRFYDPSIAAWRSTWIGPMHRWVMSFVAQRINRELVLEDPVEQSLRWIFSDIEQASFRWRNELQTETGNWRVQQRFQATRQASQKFI